MELAVVTLFIFSSFISVALPLVAHWASLQPQSIDSIMTPIAGLIPPPAAHTLVLSPAAVRAARRR